MKKIVFFSSLFLYFLMACKFSPQLKDTVISLKEIKDIGELVTAEYSGEVITSLNLMDEREKKQNITDDKELVFNDFFSLFNNDSGLKIDHQGLKKFQQCSSDRAFSAFERLAKVTGDCNLKLLINCCNLNENNFLEYYKLKIDKYLIPSGKNEIVYLARGSVKIGYDLKNLEKLNLVFSSNGDTLYLNNFDPYQTNIDINPWFYCPDIDQDGFVKGDSSLFGFQLIYAEKGKTATLDEINKVKNDCKILLYQQALDRDIFGIGKRNAESALSGLLTLLKNPNTNLKKVVIRHSCYFDMKMELIYDLSISDNELDSLKHFLKNEIQHIQTLNENSEQKRMRMLYGFISDIYNSCFYHENAIGWEDFALESMKDIKAKTIYK
jgi:hypothetical protein